MMRNNDVDVHRNQYEYLYYRITLVSIDSLFHARSQLLSKQSLNVIFVGFSLKFDKAIFF